MVSLSSTYGGNARKTIKGSKQRLSKNNAPRISSRWLAGQRGCWVCGKSHKARERHSEEEIIDAMSKLREKHSNAMFTISDLALISDDLTFESNEFVDNMSENIDENDIVLSEDEGDELYFTCAEASLHKEHEGQFANISFLHGRTYNSDYSLPLYTMKREL